MPAAPEDTLRFEQRGEIGYLRLARPFKRNALSDELVRSLHGLAR